MTVGELAEKFRELFGFPTRTRNKPYLRKRVAWLPMKRRPVNSRPMPHKPGATRLIRRIGGRCAAPAVVQSTITQRPSPLIGGSFCSALGVDVAAGRDTEPACVSPTVRSRG